MTRAKAITEAVCKYLRIFDQYNIIGNTVGIGTWCYIHPVHPGSMYHCLCSYTARTNGRKEYISEVIPGTPVFKFMGVLRTCVVAPYMDIYMY